MGPTRPLPISLFEYDLPQGRIAQEPARPRDASRLMVLHRRSGAVAHHGFADLPERLSPGDLLVINRTRVMPARLWIERPAGRPVELLLCRPINDSLSNATEWEAMGRPGKPLRPGRTHRLMDGTTLTVIERLGMTFRVRASRPFWEVMSTLGQVPLPPYIFRPEGTWDSDPYDYQTIFAREPGAVAAPTASLHFTDRVLDRLRERGIGLADLVLHVGPGTFLPVREAHSADVRGHPMHSESYEIPASTLAAVDQTRQRGGRVVAVGTTCVRALETWAGTGQRFGESSLFVVPGFRFRVVDAMLTNFHLPRSTLLMLVCAFAGRDAVLGAYAQAIAEGYRFFSYGDAMLIFDSMDGS